MRPRLIAKGSGRSIGAPAVSHAQLWDKAMAARMRVCERLRRVRFYGAERIALRPRQHVAHRLRIATGHRVATRAVEGHAWTKDSARVTAERSTRLAARGGEGAAGAVWGHAPENLEPSSAST